MPDWCTYSMRVSAPDKESIASLEPIMLDSEHPRHFTRVLSAEGFDGATPTPDGGWAAFIDGLCAWSVESCMCSGYDPSRRERAPESITLQQASRLLGLRIEVYAKEPGSMIQEHYLYDEGVELAYEEQDYLEYVYDGSQGWEAWLYENDLDISKDDLDENGAYTIGGFEWRFSA